MAAKKPKKSKWMNPTPSRPTAKPYSDRPSRRPTSPNPSSRSFAKRFGV